MATKNDTANPTELLLWGMVQTAPMLRMLEWLCVQLMKAEVSSKLGAEKNMHCKPYCRLTSAIVMANFSFTMRAIPRRGCFYHIGWSRLHVKQKMKRHNALARFKIRYNGAFSHKVIGLQQIRLLICLRQFQ